MSVKVRDTLSGERVEVGDDGKVGLYVCGPTVYNHIHIGNVRAPLFWDVVVRYLRSRGYEVTFVQNVTDVEDKIIAKANEEGVSWEKIVERYTRSFHERLGLMGVGLPDIEPRATEHIPEMITLIEDLIEDGHAYAPGNGDVYYSVESYPEYGRLSRQRAGDMRETEKGQTGHKRSALDFALWKASKPGEPTWESPWGPGRPGWHIECSAMVEKHLPGGADIHGGGTDLLFPHHENELAQSAGAHPERTFVQVWAHHGMVNFIGDKMSKSVGNILDAKEAVELHGRNAVRMWFLQSHYSQPIDYSGEILEEKRRSFERLLRLYRQVSGSKSSSVLSGDLATELRERFDAAMSDDFDTSGAIAAVFEAARRAGREISARPEAAGEFASLGDAMEEILTVLGFDLTTGRIYKLTLTATVGVEASATTERIEAEPAQEELPPKVQRMVAERENARRGKDWVTADRLRDELGAGGWSVEDTPEGPILTRA